MKRCGLCPFQRDFPRLCSIGLFFLKSHCIQPRLILWQGKSPQDRSNFWEQARTLSDVASYSFCSFSPQSSDDLAERKQLWTVAAWYRGGLLCIPDEGRRWGRWRWKTEDVDARHTPLLCEGRLKQYSWLMWHLGIAKTEQALRAWTDYRKLL